MHCPARKRGHIDSEVPSNVPWIFQYLPWEYDPADSTRETLTDWWAMNRGQRHVASGDAVYFLRAGPMAAITAVGEITRTTYAYHSNGKSAVDFTVQWFVDPDLTRAEIATHEVLGELIAMLKSSTNREIQDRTGLARSTIQRIRNNRVKPRKRTVASLTSSAGNGDAGCDLSHAP
jgi:hypothetical protein